VKKGGRVFAEGEDAESYEFELCVCGLIGVCAEGGGEADKVLARTAGVFGDLEEDLVDKGGG
jgi:hypothetical protein